MEEFWKDDFRPLQWAGKSILQAMREDEEATDADLYRRLTQSQEGSHLYFQSETPSSSSTTTNDSSMANGWGGLGGSGNVTPRGGGGLSSPFTSNSARNTSKTAPPLVSLKHRKSLPLPSMLTEALKQVRTSSFMGLLLPVEMAWMTVDEKLFLFSSEDPSQGMIQCFENPRKQPILAVALVKPRKGKFCIEWVCQGPTTGITWYN